MEERSRIPNTLSIAGLDPSGGAGILADVKAMSAMGAYACAVVAALTAQNTRAVSGISPVEPSFVAKQIDTLFTDVRIDAVKIGMLAESRVIETVAERLAYWKPRWIVLDPVMVAKSGDALIAEEALSMLRERLLPMADIVTPNLPEAAALLGEPVRTFEQMPDAARKLWQLSHHHAVIYLKGGHLETGECADVVFDGTSFETLRSPRFATKNTHGTGCTLSSAIAALLPVCPSAIEAMRRAKAYMTEAIAHADELEVGLGHGPVHHFHTLWQSKSA